MQQPATLSDDGRMTCKAEGMSVVRPVLCALAVTSRKEIMRSGAQVLPLFGRQPWAGLEA